MKVLLAGGSGLVGGLLRDAWAKAGHSVTRLVRRAPGGKDEMQWAPESGTCSGLETESFDAIVNLAGANIAAGRWTADRKARLRASRLDSTGLLARMIVEGRLRSGVFVNASAVGFYGDTGEREVDESSPAGSGFLASLCTEWEAAADAAGSATRVVKLRLGVVLDSEGGALAKLLPLFRSGLGGPIGDGSGWMSWIGNNDLCRMVDFVCTDHSVCGAVNAVAPHPVRNRDFVAALGACLGRPAVVRTPATMIRLLLGQMGAETVLSSQRVVPAKLVEAGFQYRQSELAGAIADAMGR